MIGPGDIVVCVDDTPPSNSDMSAKVVKGKLYRVLDILFDGTAITLYDMDPWPYQAWRIERFAPLDWNPEKEYASMFAPSPVVKEKVEQQDDAYTESA